MTDARLIPGLLSINNKKIKTLEINNKQVKSIATQDGDVIWQKTSSVIFNPPLDGTDAITKWTSATNNTSNGIYHSHGSFLTDGWSNEGLWKLEFDVMTTSWTYIGLMPVCSAEINPFTDTKATNYAMTSWEGLTYFGGLGASVVSEDSMSKIKSTNTWHHVSIEKLNDTQCKIIINNTYTSIRNYANLPNLQTLHFGTRDNPSSRNSGGIIQFKNIIVTSI